MYKLVTNDSLVHPLTTLPYEGRFEVKGIDTSVLCIPFGEEYDTIAKIREVVNDNVKMAILHVYDGDQLVAEYKNYFILQQIATERFTIDDKEVEVLVAKMSKESTIPEQLKELTDKLTKVEKEKKALEESYSDFKDTTCKKLEETSTTVGNISENVTNFIDSATESVKQLSKNTESLKTDLDEAKKTAEAASGVAESVNRTVSNINESIESMSKTMNSNFEEISKNEAIRGETIAQIENTVNELHTEIKGLNEEDMTIDQLKDHRILMSKANLHEFLENAVVRSDVHGGLEEEYSITEEKQTQLMAMIMMASLNPDYQPSWNAKGKPCSYDWTVDELKYLAGQIEYIVRPLISKQQHMETDIKDATTIEEVMGVDITFSIAP